MNGGLCARACTYASDAREDAQWSACTHIYVQTRTWGMVRSDQLARTDTVPRGVVHAECACKHVYLLSRTILDFTVSTSRWTG